VAPLDISLRARLINLMSTVECNGATAYTTSYLVGVGSPLPLMTSWGVAWSAQLTKMKYYDGTSYVAKQQLSTNNVDFGLVSDGLSAEWHSVMSDAALMPITAYALVPSTTQPFVGINRFFVFSCNALVCAICTTGYYVPELAGLELVLDFDTIARIYLNEITMWDDERIKALNSDAVVAALPSQPIIVITQSIAAGTTSTFTAVLTATVPDFAAQVGHPSRFSGSSLFRLIMRVWR
jgi:ABC-type phosphate transport system substrate-binding protein